MHSIIVWLNLKQFLSFCPEIYFYLLRYSFKPGMSLFVILQITDYCSRSITDTQCSAPGVRVFINELADLDEDEETEGVSGNLINRMVNGDPAVWQLVPWGVQWDLHVRGEHCQDHRQEWRAGIRIKELILKFCHLFVIDFTVVIWLLSLEVPHFQL